MSSHKAELVREFRHTIRWIVVLAILVVIGALVFAASQTELTFHIVLASILGVFFSVLLGAGLFALAFLSDRSGHDDQVRGATTRRNAKDHERRDVPAEDTPNA